MRGTEKQIKWAEELVERFNEEMESLIAMIPEKEKQDVIRDLILNKYNKLFSEAYAGDIIDAMKNLNNLHGREYYSMLTSAFRVSATELSMKVKNEILKK